MTGEKFLAICVVAMVTIVHSFSFTNPALHSYRSNNGSFESRVSSSSALGMATWSNGKLMKMHIRAIGAKFNTRK